MKCDIEFSICVKVILLVTLSKRFILWIGLISDTLILFLYMKINVAYGRYIINCITFSENYHRFLTHLYCIDFRTLEFSYDNFFRLSTPIFVSTNRYYSTTFVRWPKCSDQGCIKMEQTLYLFKNKIMKYC